MSHRVLLVEDSAVMRTAITTMLATECDVVDWVGDGREVMSKAAEMAPTTIILDISLPGIGGLTLLPLLRETHPHVTIVMLTNHAEDAYRTEALARGADAYVLKPAAPLELLPAIRRGRPAMRRAAPEVGL